jgi:replicative DNA helicase
MMSGESGAATMQETARRIAASKGLTLGKCENAVWSFDVPQLGNFLHTQALRQFIEIHSLEVLILDPTYLMMMSLGDDAGNLFVVGSLLKTLGDLAQQTGCTPLLCHHLKKSLAEPYEPAELENIAWAGFQEFVRQWLLLNRRVRYDPDRGGHHELWMSVGGSAGHSGLWGLNIEEGTRQSVGGRHWDVAVTSASDAFHERREAQEMADEVCKERQMERRSEKQCKAVLRALRQFPDGETSRVIREAAGIGAKSIQGVLDELVADGLVVRCSVTKNKREEPAYRLV